ncbi:hypothetical protein EYZ11_005270 [Aspergillus tanneri]|uniref:Uncharacterized protein n=1 Tax=Aspergillus tanneri TaxID=1220188 RepID=A0A4S3JIM2_9EURO|nr:hypothetical protein EYZ11_005270 [Aspergillus tanneri]
MSPHTSAATEEPVRQSAAPSVDSFILREFAFLAQPMPAENQRQFQKKPSGLAPPQLGQKPTISPIPEEGYDSPAVHKGSFASSKVVPSSWGSARAESEILRTYLEAESDGEHSHRSPSDERNVFPVRQASLGKRGKPVLRTIPIPNADSQMPPAQGPVPRMAVMKEAPGHPNGRSRSFSASTISSHSTSRQAPFMLDLSYEHLPTRINNDMDASGNEMGVFPKTAPTMSDKRPGGHRPPRLDIEAVRDAEKRGSVTSLPDLIRRATQLASNLEHGRTASKNNLLDFDGGPKFPRGHEYRRSGSIKDIIASFPPPAAAPDAGRPLWPAFFKRSTLHQIQSQEVVPEAGNEKVEKRPRRCFSGDSGCTTVEIGKGSSSKNATMGTDLPRLFDSAQRNFSIPLDSVTIMALFSQNNVSCTTENTLVAFKDVNANSKNRRALPIAPGPQLLSPEKMSDPESPTPTTSDAGTRTLAARGAAGTLNGIVFDTSVPIGNQQDGLPTATKTSAATHTGTSSATSSSTPNSTGGNSTSVPAKAIDFSRIAVLYIFEKTGTFRAATFSEDRVQTYLQKSYPYSNKKTFSIDLTDAGVKSTFALDFDWYKITLPNGDVIGGS